MFRDGCNDWNVNLSISEEESIITCTSTRFEKKNLILVYFGGGGRATSLCLSAIHIGAY